MVGTPLDFRLGFGDFGAAREVVHLADAAEGVATHGRWPGRRAATWPRSSTALAGGRVTGSRTSRGWSRLRAAEDAAGPRDGTSAPTAAR